MNLPPVGASFREAAPCSEMLSVFSEPAIEIVRVTTNPDHDAHCRHMQVAHDLFTPDSRHVVIERQNGRGCGRVEYLLCDLEDGFSLLVLTDDASPTSPLIGRDGRYFYYLANPPDPAAGSGITLKRVDLHTFKTEILTVFDAPVAGIGKRPLVSMGAASLRADGQVICGGFNFQADDGKPHFAPVFIALDTLEIRGFDWEPYSWRVGGNYYRGEDPAHRQHLLMCRCNRSQHWESDGRYSEVWYGDVRLTQMFIVDEGGDIVGIVPIGGAGERVDHPTWWGGRYEVVTHSGRTDTAPHWRGTMMSAAPIVCEPALWKNPQDIPGARRVELTRKIVRPDVCHHAWDQSGTRVVADIEGWHPPMGPAAHLWIGTVVENAGEDPCVVPKFLLNPRSTWTGNYWTQSQPVISPDCKTILFNSDWLNQPGHPQVFAVRGFVFPEVRSQGVGFERSAYRHHGRSSAGPGGATP